MFFLVSLGMRLLFNLRKVRSEQVSAEMRKVTINSY